MTKKILVSLSTLGPLGYVPCSGTVATLVTIVFLYLASAVIEYSVLLYSLTLVLALLGSYLVSSYAINHFNIEDPSQVVIDEVLGTLITFINIPLELPYLILGFCLFRFFDITKCLGIKKLEHIGNGWGVILDDVAAAILSNIVLHCIVFLCK